MAAFFLLDPRSLVLTITGVVCYHVSSLASFTVITHS
jgi:hypothetical protein